MMTEALFAIPSNQDEEPASGSELDGDARPASRKLLRFIVRRPGLVVSLLLILFVLTAAFFPGLFTSRSPTVGVVADRLSPPSFDHWFGTDATGRDVYARMVYGAHLSVQAMVLAVALAMFVGGGIGLIAGYAGRWTDTLLMRAIDVLLAIPYLLLALAFITALGYGSIRVAIAVGFASIAVFARLMRAEVLRVNNEVFVEASRSSGARSYQVLWWHILPNTIGPLLILATVQLGIAILAISALSFLGYGAPVPAPEWGSIIADGRNYLATAWWLTTLPGLLVAAVVLATNRIARALDGEWSRFR